MMVVVHEHRSLRRAPNRHSEPWARNPEAALLRVLIPCSVPAPKLGPRPLHNALMRARTPRDFSPKPALSNVEGARNDGAPGPHLRAFCSDSRAGMSQRSGRSLMQQPLAAEPFQRSAASVRFPNDRSGFCQICSGLNCSALCPNPLRAKMIPWKPTAHYSDPFCRPHSTSLLPRPGAVINPTTKTPRRKEMTHFRAPRAEMNILRVLVSSSSLVPSCLVFLAASERPKFEVPKKRSKRTHSANSPASSRSLFSKPLEKIPNEPTAKRPRSKNQRPNLV